MRYLAALVALAWGYVALLAVWRESADWSARLGAFLALLLLVVVWRVLGLVIGRDRRAGGGDVAVAESLRGSAGSDLVGSAAAAPRLRRVRLRVAHPGRGTGLDDA